MHRRALLGLFGAGAGAAAVAMWPGTAQAHTPATAERAAVFPVSDFGAVGDGVADDTAAIQDAITEASIKGGVVYLPAGNYRLTRQPGEATLTLKSKVTIKGDGVGTHIFLDPATIPNPARHYVMRVGEQSVAASDVVVEGIRLTVNQSVIGGGSLLGICARHDGADKTIHSDNVVVRDCTIIDSQIAVGCTKSAVTGPYPESRLNAQFRHWVVENCVLDLSGNKMVEFGECDHGVIRGNVMSRCKDGPQAIFHSRNILIEGNRISYTVSGINVTAGCNNVTIVGNTVEADPSISPGSAYSALYFRTEATASTDYVQADIRSIGNVYRDRYTTSRRAFRTGTRAEVSSSTYERVSFLGDIFDGNVELSDLMAPSKSVIRGFTFSGCTFFGDIANAAANVTTSADITFTGCDLMRDSGYTINADRWTLNGCRIHGPLALNNSAHAAIVTGNRIEGSVNGVGTNSVVEANLEL